MTDARIAALTPEPSVVDMLANLLVETVDNGGSVHFMAPLAKSDAIEFWRQSLAAAERGERLLFGAFDDRLLVSTVTLQLAGPPNQPHRCEIAKMMTRRSHRGRGLARALLLHAEAEARRQGRSLAVLDTASDGGAAGLYEAIGYQLAGEIPDYAYKPHGGMTGTLIYWKRL